MLIRFIIMVIYFSTLISSAYMSHAKIFNHAPTPLPIQTLLGLNGKEYSLDQLDGNVLLIHFWATWCSSCTDQMKALNQLQKLVRKDKIIVLPVSEDFKGPEIIKKFYTALNLNYLSAFIDQNNKWFKELKVQNLPTTFIVDTQGMKVATVTGGIDWLNEENIKMVKQYLSDKHSYNSDYVSLITDNPVIKESSTNKSMSKNPKHLNQIETNLAPSSTEPLDEDGAIKMTNDVQSLETNLKIRRPVNVD